MIDTLIRNATVIDGTGSVPFVADIAITADKIVAVGKISGVAHRTIDADGLIATPGFVDIHTHYDGQVSWDGVLKPSSQHGVTSVVMGNCGVGFAPCRASDHAKLISLLEGVEDIPGTALTEGLTWDWESFPDYLDAIERRSFAIDVGAQVPHAALRTYVMGDPGADHTANPRDAEIDRMEQLTYEALIAGAVGFSTSRSLAHRTIEGDNIGTLTASERELSFGARALRRAGSGVFQLISDAYLTGDNNFVAAEIRLIRRLAEVSGRPLSFSLMQSPVASRWQVLLDETARLNDEGFNIRTQVAPRPIGAIMGLSGTINPFYTTPTYKELMTQSFDERVSRFGQPDIKARILLEHASASREDIAASIMLDCFDGLFRMTDPVDYEPNRADSIGAEALQHSQSPADYLYDVLLEEGGTRLLYYPVMNYFDGDLNATFSMMASKYSLYGLSDGGAHCGTICDASFPTTAMALWSRGNRSGLRLPLETLVHGYTQRNSAHVGWHDRGVIAPGYLADLNIIDMQALDLPPPFITGDLPTGGNRLLQPPRGYRNTLKRGVVTFDGGEWTGELPGKLVRGEKHLQASTS